MLEAALLETKLRKYRVRWFGQGQQRLISAAKKSDRIVLMKK